MINLSHGLWITVINFMYTFDTFTEKVIAYNGISLVQDLFIFFIASEKYASISTYQPTYVPLKNGAAIKFHRKVNFIQGFFITSLEIIQLNSFIASEIILR